MPQISPDGLTYTVKLKKNAKFHPPLSRAVTADDVVFSWQRYSGQVAGVPANAGLSSVAAYLDTVEKVDDSTVRFKLKKPRGDFLVSEAKWLQIMPKEAGTAFDPAQKMVGTGPWIFDSYTPGSVIKFKRNADWHLGPEAPYLDAVEINFIKEYATRLTQFLGGNLDECDVSGNDLGRVKDTLKSAQVIVREAVLPASYITFDGSARAANAPWRDPRVRKAMSMAIDRDSLLDAAYNVKDVEKLGLKVERRWNNDMPSFESGYWLDPQGKFQIKASDPKVSADNAKSFKYDPTEAKKLLDAAAQGSGFKTKLHTTSSRYGQAFNILTELLQQYLAAVGIQTELVDEDYASVYVTKTALGDFDGIAHIPRGPGARGQFELYYSAKGIRNNAKIDDQALFDRVQKMLSMSDPEQARTEMLSLQSYTNDKMYLVPMQLGGSGDYYAYSSKVHNAVEYQVNSYDLGTEAFPYFWKEA